MARRTATLRGLILIALVFAGVCPLHAQQAARILDAVGVTRSASAIDVSLRFNCVLRYLGSSSADASTLLRIPVAVDAGCGDAHAELLPPAGHESLLRSIELIPLLTGQAELRIEWVQAERTAVAPGVAGSGLRIRLLRPGLETSKPRVFISDTPPASGYAINLDSSQEPFAPAAVATAQDWLQTRAYVSEITLDGVRWFRLRVGPVATRDQAERTLLVAQQRYPRAWLAINDESGSETDAPVADVPAAATAGAAMNPAEIIDPAQADALFRSARADVRRRDYATAIQSLTKVIRGTPPGQRPQARELLGIARERNGQLAHAKAEYQAYLREFPEGAAAQRVRARLRSLSTATRSRSKGLFDRSDEDGYAWRLYGGVAQTYRRDNNEISSSNPLVTGPSGASQASFASQNSLLNDFDMVARRHGIQFDAIARVSAGYIKDLLAQGPGDRVRVSSAYVEIIDRERGWSSRVGRQTRTTNGLLGTFDGIFGSYRLLPHLTVNGAFGLPVESSYDGVDTSRQLAALALDFGIFGDAWEPSVYFVNQTIDAVTDRQGVGVELHYFRPGRVLVGFIDYDLHFQELNSTVLIGTLALPAQWTLNADVERRKSPILSTRNALIGQPLDGFSELLDAFDEAQIRRLALDRSVDTDVYALSLSRPLGERWQFMLNSARFASGDMPPSGGVEGIPSQGSETMVAAQLLGLSLLRSGDLHALGVRYQSGATMQMQSLGINSRLPAWGGWRIGPQLRADRRVFTPDGSIQWIYVPSLRLDLLKSRFWVEVELGAELASRTAPTLNEDTRRFYGSLGWRLNF